MRSWYSWLLSRDLHLKRVDTILIGLRHVDTPTLVEHLYPYIKKNETDAEKEKRDRDIKAAFSTEGTKLRIKVIDKIIAECVTL